MVGNGFSVHFLFIVSPMFSTLPKRVWLLIIITTLLRLIAATFSELGNDEVYYWTYAQHLQWNYFDHPPMVAIWIRLFTGNLTLEKFELFIRLGSIVGCIISTIFIFLIGKNIHSEKAGWFGACLYNASIYASIMAGIFILPDSPQMIFWTGSLYLLIKVIKYPARWIHWILFGICTGLCIMSKVHGIFLWFGFGLYILFQKREYLKNPRLYISIILTAIIISPILLWNISNHFITYKFHSERAVSNIFHPNFFGLTREIYGQFLYSNPFNVIVIVSALIAWHKRKMNHFELLTLYNFIAIPMISVFIVMSFFGDTLPHWSGPAYIALIPIAAVYLGEKKAITIFPKQIKWTLGFSIILLPVGLLIINYFPGTIGTKDSKELGSMDVSLDMYGWKQGGELFRQIYLSEQKNGLMLKGTPVVCYNWFPAAHEDYYFCHPLNIKLMGLGPIFNLHHYLWLNTYNLSKVNMQNAYCIVPSNEHHEAKEVYKRYYDEIDSITTIKTYRNSKVCRTFTVYRLLHWNGILPQLGVNNAFF